jgi:hypothetical protein
MLRRSCRDCQRENHEGTKEQSKHEDDAKPYKDLNLGPT